MQKVTRTSGRTVVRAFLVACACLMLGGVCLGEARHALAPASQAGGRDSDAMRAAAVAAGYHATFGETRRSDFPALQKQMRFIGPAIMETWPRGISPDTLVMLLDLTILKGLAHRSGVVQQITDYLGDGETLLVVEELFPENPGSVSWHVVAEEILMLTALDLANSRIMSDIVSVKDYLNSRDDRRIVEPYFKISAAWAGPLKTEVYPWLFANASEEFTAEMVSLHFGGRERDDEANIARALAVTRAGPAVIRAAIPFLSFEHAVAGRQETARQRARDVLRAATPQGHVELIRHFRSADREMAAAMLDVLKDNPELLPDVWYGELIRHRLAVPDRRELVNAIISEKMDIKDWLGPLMQSIDRDVLQGFTEVLSVRGLGREVGPALRVLAKPEHARHAERLIAKITALVGRSEWEGLMQLFGSQRDPARRRIVASILDAAGTLEPEDIGAVYGPIAHGRLLPFVELAPIGFAGLADLMESVDLHREEDVERVVRHMEDLEKKVGRDFLQEMLKRHGIPYVLNIRSVRHQIPVFVGPNFSLRIPRPAAEKLRGIPGVSFGPPQVVFSMMHFDRNATPDPEKKEKVALHKELRRLNDEALKELQTYQRAKSSAQSSEMTQHRERISALLREMIGTLKALYSNIALLEGLDEKLAEIEQTIESVLRDGDANEKDTRVRRLVWAFRREMDLGSVTTLHTFLGYLHTLADEGLFEGTRPRYDDWKKPAHLVTGILDATGKEVLVTHPVSNLDENGTYSEALRYTSELLMDTADMEHHATSYQIVVEGDLVVLFKQIFGHRTEMRIQFARPELGGVVQIHWNDNVDYSAEEFDIIPRETPAGLSNKDVNDLRRGLVRQALSDLNFQIRVPTSDTMTPVDRTSLGGPEAALHASLDKDAGAGSIEDIYEAAKMALEILSATPDLDNHISKNYPDAPLAYRGEDYVDLMVEFLHTMGVAEFRRVVEETNLRFQTQMKSMEQVGKEVYAGLNDMMEELQLPLLPLADEQPLGQPLIDQSLRRVIEEAIRLKWVTRKPDGSLERNPHATRRVRMELLADSVQDDVMLNEMITQGKIIESVRDKLTFSTMGSLNGYWVEKATFYAHDRLVTLVVVLDLNGDILFGTSNFGQFVFDIVDPDTGVVSSNLIRDPDQLLTELQKNIPEASKPALQWGGQAWRWRKVRSEIRKTLERRIPRSSIGEYWVPIEAMPIARKKTSGRVIFSTDTRKADRSGIPIEEGVLVTSRIMPEDEHLMGRALGMAVTGGSPLQHAGVIAREIGLPSVIIQGKWRGKGDHMYLQIQYDDFEPYGGERHGYQLLGRKNLRRRTTRLREGDIVVVDGDKGQLLLLSLSKEERADIRAVFNAITDYRKNPGIKAVEKLLEHITPETTFRVGAYLLGELVFWDTRSSGHERRSIFREIMQRASPRLREEILRRLGEIREQSIIEIEYAISQTVQELNTKVRSPMDMARVMSSLEKEIMGLRDIELLLRVDPADFGKGIPHLREAYDQRLKQLRQDLERAAEAMPSRVDEASGLVALFRASDLLEHRPERVQRLRAAYKAAREGSMAKHARDAVLPFLDRGTPVSWLVADLVGGKIANLGELMHRGIAVPPGFGITTTVFKRYLSQEVAWRGESKTIAEWIDFILARPLPDQEKYENIRDVIGRGDFDAIPGDKAAIQYWYGRMGRPAVAVRSSAAQEDRGQATWAGQMETILNVQTEEGVFEAIRDVWASYWTPQAIDYRRSRGIPTDYEHAVGVQRMRGRPRSSGMMETMDPLKLDPERLVVSAAFGLATASGGNSPDTFVLGRDGEQLEAPLIAAKKDRWISDPGGGIKQVPVLKGINDPSLTDFELKELATMGLHIEEMYGVPVYIEFVFDDEGLTILQSRPVAKADRTLMDLAPDFILERYEDRDLKGAEAERVAARIKEVGALVRKAAHALSSGERATLLEDEVLEDVRRYLLEHYPYRGPGEIHFVSPSAPIDHTLRRWVDEGHLLFPLGREGTEPISPVGLGDLLPEFSL